MDGKNLNRCFPDDSNGSYTDKLAHFVFEEFIVGADALLDPHAGDLLESLMPFVLHDESVVEDASRALADSYGPAHVVRQSRSDGAIGAAALRACPRHRERYGSGWPGVLPTGTRLGSVLFPAPGRAHRTDRMIRLYTL